MKWFTRRRRFVPGMVLLVLITAFIFTGTAQAQSAAPASPWRFSITPYLWLPNMSGTLNYGPPPANGSPSVEVDNNPLESLEAALMISGEARRDRWSVFTDFIYLNFSNDSSSVKSINFGGSAVSSSANVSTQSSLRGVVWTLGTGYAVLPPKPLALDVFGGLRYAGLEPSTDWQLSTTVTGPGGGQTFPQAGSISQRTDLWNGILGVRGLYWLGDSKWSIPYYLDVGAGSGWTWQGMLGIAYSFNRVDVKLVYRHLYFDQGSDNLIQDLSFSGPALGVTFRF
jgi:hypothetical protein